MTTWIDVVDTAIKIGLGSLVTGVASYLLFKQKHVADASKEYRYERRTLIKELAIKLEDVETHINEAVVCLSHDDVASTQKALIPAGKEIYMVRAYTNMLGAQDMIPIINDISFLIEEVYSEITSIPISQERVKTLVTKNLPALKQSAYPHIRKLYEETNA